MGVKERPDYSRECLSEPRGLYRPRRHWSLPSSQQLRQSAFFQDTCVVAMFLRSSAFFRVCGFQYSLRMAGTFDYLRATRSCDFTLLARRDILSRGHIGLVVNKGSRPLTPGTRLFAASFGQRNS